jgi:hypothetical protein
MPSLAISGNLPDEAQTLRLARGRCRSRAGNPARLRWKKAGRGTGSNWARFMRRRSFSAVGGIFTAIRSSPALEEAMRWLAGQIPQMRAVMAGISVDGPPLAELLEAAELGHVEARVGHLPGRRRGTMVILACPSMRVTGSMVMVFVMGSPAWIIRSAGRSSAGSSGMRPSSRAVTGEEDGVGVGRAPGEERIHLHLVQRHGCFSKPARRRYPGTAGIRRRSPRRRGG